ncbi:hypothetical protein HA402_007660 [Bradysia odoriphaga]|nr:hypothetical protein HA402_007660 [Bradysia odoriphaga]
MPIICEPVDNVKESAKYMSDKEFVHAYPKPNPNTPLGSSWQFAPCFLPKKANFVELTPSQKFVSELPASLNELKDNIKMKSFHAFKLLCEPFTDAILDFDIQSIDVLVCSLPKCGSTWMQTIVWLLTHGLNYEAVRKVNRAEQMGDFDELLNGTAAKKISSKLIANDKSLSESDALKMGWNEIFKQLATPRVIKAHYPVYFLPKQIWSKFLCRSQSERHGLFTVSHAAKLFPR